MLFLFTIIRAKHGLQYLMIYLNIVNDETGQMPKIAAAFPTIKIQFNAFAGTKNNETVQTSCVSHIGLTCGFTSAKNIMKHAASLMVC